MRQLHLFKSIIAICKRLQYYPFMTYMGAGDTWETITPGKERAPAHPSTQTPEKPTAAQLVLRLAAHVDTFPNHTPAALNLPPGTKAGYIEDNLVRMHTQWSKVKFAIPVPSGMDEFLPICTNPQAVDLAINFLGRGYSQGDRIELTVEAVGNELEIFATRFSWNKNEQKFKQGHTEQIHPLVFGKIIDAIKYKPKTQPAIEVSPKRLRSDYGNTFPRDDELFPWYR